MSRVTVASEMKQESGRSASGKDYTEKWQEGYLHEAGKPYPTSCKIPLYDNARPFPLGEFQTEQALEINQFNRLRVKTDLLLSPVPAAK